MILCIQKGARDHYQVAQMAENAGLLSMLLTDWWAGFIGETVRKRLSHGPRIMRAAMARHNPSIPNSRVRSNLMLGAWLDLSSRFGIDRYMGDWNSSELFARWLDRESEAVKFTSLHCYSGEASLLVKKVRRAKRRVIVSQVDTAEHLQKTVEIEKERFPSLQAGHQHERLIDMASIKSDWCAADSVVVNSEWSRRALIQQQVDPSKLVVIPLAFDGVRLKKKKRPRKRLRVLWLGRLALEKGLPYALQAARLLKGEDVTFSFVGHKGFEGLPMFGENCTYAGAVSRASVNYWYDSHDVLLFPTLNDGFGMTQLEAMARGLPVIATKCCGDVVEHGRSGIVVSPRDPEGIVLALRSLLYSDDLWQTLSVGALARSCAFRSGEVWRDYRKVFQL